MSERFSFSRPQSRGLTDPWFRVGAVDIGSAALLALLGAVSILVYGLEPRDKPILTSLALLPDKVLGGQIWRVATWPLANGFDQRLLWTAVSIALLWHFGGQLEQRVGRIPMAFFLASIIVVPGVIGALLDLPQAGLRSIQIVTMLTFIAEYPNLKFFFGIPAWALGLVYVVTDILQITGARAGRVLLFYVLSLVVGALAARSIGLLEAYPWIPKAPLPAALSGSSSGRRSRKKPAPRRSGGAKVVDGPWKNAPAPTAPPVGPSAADQAELDGLLDQIGANGMDSLSANEKKRLNELSKRLRNS